MGDKLNIYQRIQKVMADVAYVQKETKQVNNQYRFVSHDAVTALLHPKLVEHGIVMVPTVVDYSQDGNRTTATMDVSFVNVDEPEDRVSIQCFGYGIDQQDKGPGKAISYATKYALLKLFVLETGDDPERDSIDHVAQQAEELAAQAKIALEKGDWAELCRIDREDSWVAAWSQIDTRKKKAIKELIAIRDKFRDVINGHAEEGDASGIAEEWESLTKEEKAQVWPALSANAQEQLKALKEAS